MYGGRDPAKGAFGFILAVVVIVFALGAWLL